MSRYAELSQELGQAGGVWNNEKHRELFNALERWLPLPEIMARIAGMEYLAAHLIVPGYEQKNTGYVRLLAAIFCIRSIARNSRQMTSSLPDVVNSWWNNILDRIATQAIPSPCSLDELTHRLVDAILEVIRQEIMPIYDSCVFELLDEMIGTLPEREQDIIKRRFGISCEPKTLEEIGESYVLSRMRIKDIEMNALGRLRREVRVRQLVMIAEPIGNALERQLEQLSAREVEARLMSRARKDADADDAVILAKLQRKFKEFDYSVRIDNCFRQKHIVYIGDAVQWNDATFLKVKNFGRKSLREVKGILAELGLSTGMSPDLQCVLAFNAWRAQQPTEQT
jgi:RNA polymerase sigma factor (sigma-70 family)